MTKVTHFMESQRADGVVHGYLVEGDIDGMWVCQAIASEKPPMLLHLGSDFAQELIAVAIERQIKTYQELNRPMLTLTPYGDKRGILAQLGIDESPQPSRNGGA